MTSVGPFVHREQLPARHQGTTASTSSIFIVIKNEVFLCHSPYPLPCPSPTTHPALFLIIFRGFSRFITVYRSFLRLFDLNLKKKSQITFFGHVVPFTTSSTTPYPTTGTTSSTSSVFHNQKQHPIFSVSFVGSNLIFKIKLNSSEFVRIHDPKHCRL